MRTVSSARFGTVSVLWAANSKKSVEHYSKTSRMTGVAPKRTAYASFVHVNGEVSTTGLFWIAGTLDVAA